MTRLLAALVGFALALPALAQPPGQGRSPQELMDEARVLQTTLEAVQAKVLQDESLSGKAEALVRDVEARMAELDPQTPSRLARLEQLRVTAEAAAASEDRAGYEGAVGEARTLQETLELTRGRVIAEDAFRLRTVAFQRELVDAMTVVEPQVPGMLKRLEEVARALGS